MKKTVLLIVVICLTALLSSAQACEYGAYYKAVAAAKKDYSKQNYKAANTKFKFAFSKTDFPLGHDLSLALVSAVKSKDHDWAGMISEKLAKGGIPLRYFAKYKKEKWFKKFHAEFENHATYYRDHLNPELRIKLVSLLEKDRKFNKKYHEWQGRKIEITLAELIYGANEILEEFKNFTEQYGFPTEQLVGYNYVQRKNAVESFSIEVLIVHIYQRGVLLFEHELPKIICAGGLHPEWEETLKKIRGFGNSTGVAQEMKARYEKFRGN